MSHLGASNLQSEYVMNDQALAQIHIEWDIGLQVDSDLKSEDRLR